MEDFASSGVWGMIILFSFLFGGLLAGNMIKRSIPFLKDSLIPTSVLGGTLLLIISVVYEAITDTEFFNTALFAGNGMSYLEIITYHTLALGFIASSLKTNGGKLSKKRSVEVFNTGVPTVATYLLQGIFGLGIALIVTVFFIKDFFPAAGILLPFGFGQGTGQAMNYGGIYETWAASGKTAWGTSQSLVNGKAFGLTIAALGFLSASFGGVIHLNIMKRHGKIKVGKKTVEGRISSEEIQGEGEIPMQESIDKLTVQVALIFVSYIFAYLLMFLLGKLLPGMKATIYGFNFLLGVLCATLVKIVINLLHKKNLIHREYTNNFLLTRTSNFFFDIMVVAGIAAIRLSALKSYWHILLILGIVGLVVTYAYNRIVAKMLFKDYPEEQFLAMYGMLTGTASTGIILLREADGNFKTPAADNLVYQNFPAIVFGFPMMLLATLAPSRPILTLIIFVLFFSALNVILFRSFIFKRRKK